MQSYSWGSGFLPMGPTYMEVVRNRDGKALYAVRRPLTVQHLHATEVDILRTLVGPGIGLLLQKEIHVRTGTPRATLQRKLRDLKDKGLVHQPQGRSGGYGITPPGIQLIMQADQGLMPT